MKNKNFLVIGNPIGHSLSPTLHNFWFKKHKLKNCLYKKQKLNAFDLAKFVKNIRSGKIYGANVTVPFKNKIIKYLDIIKGDAIKTNSVNTLYLQNDKLIGDNTDVYGFTKGVLEKIKSKPKTAAIIAAGGVVPSIIQSLINKNIKKIYITNRTYKKILNLKKIFKKRIISIKFGQHENFFNDVDILINASTLGMLGQKELNFNFKKTKKKMNVVDIVYNPEKTKFLKDAQVCKHNIISGLEMFIYQAQKAFIIWHKKSPLINKQMYQILRKAIND